jgi:hypothetical protein
MDYDPEVLESTKTDVFFSKRMTSRKRSAIQRPKRSPTFLQVSAYDKERNVRRVLWLIQTDMTQLP